MAPGFVAGGAFYATKSQWYAGGKGFHFARALSQLGDSPLVVAPLGGSTGQIVADLASGEAIPVKVVMVSASTRSGLVILDPKIQTVTELYELGSPLQPNEWHTLEESLLKLLSEGQIITVCGSFPPGAPSNFLPRLVARSKAINKPILLDTYGAQLSEALLYGPDVVKINQHEAGDLLGEAISTPHQALEAALQIRALGALAVVITLGAQGAVGVDKQGSSFGWGNPPVEGKYPVGSGDSFFAGLVYGLVRGQSLAESARIGIAAGAANTLTTSPGELDKNTVLMLMEQIKQTASGTAPIDGG